MKATDILRYVDNLGRVSIPMEFRKKFNIHEGDMLEIYIDETTQTIAFRKWENPE